MDYTMMYKREKPSQKMTEKEVILSVKESLESKGYNAINQMVGYMISGDPTYITSFNDARTTITMYERDELLEEMISFYIENKR